MNLKNKQQLERLWDQPIDPPRRQKYELRKNPMTFDQETEEFEATAALLDVMRERKRQIEVENYTLQDDIKHNADHELASAAVAYIYDNQNMWSPFPENTFKPTTRRRNLVKAAAMLLAEIERIDYLNDE